MSIFRRGEIWYASFTTAGGKRVKQSLGTSDKQQAQELHDKIKAESWRIVKLGEPVSMTFEEACVRWINEKSEKKSLSDDKHIIKFWLESMAGKQLRDISEREIYAAVARIENGTTSTGGNKKPSPAQERESLHQSTHRNSHLREQG